MSANQLANLQHQLWQAGDRVAGLEREQRQHMEQLAALTAQRDRLRRYAQAVEAYEATVGDFPDADLPALSDRLTERAAARRAARQACLEAGDLEGDGE